VPVSWNECADWLDAGGVVWRETDRCRTSYSADDFRADVPGGRNKRKVDEFRLLPPPSLVPAPEGMDGGGWLGQGKDVPDGWPWRGFTDDTWEESRSADNTYIVQCRPPAPKREPEWVPLTKLVGRTVWGETYAVKDWAIYPSSGRWTAEGYRGSRPFPDGTLDLDTGRVKVEPEGEQ
jgi:hypothetical protein